MMQGNYVMQGDAYGLPFVIKSNGEALTPDDVTDVEITVGSLSKTYGDGHVRYENGEWIFPLTQKETFNLPVSQIEVQLRILFKDGALEGADLGIIDVKHSISRRML